MIYKKPLIGNWEYGYFFDQGYGYRLINNTYCGAYDTTKVNSNNNVFFS